MSLRNMRLGDLLKRLELVDEEEIDKALKLQMENKNGLAMGEILLRNNTVSRDQLIPVLEHQIGCTYVDLKSTNIEESVARYISEDIARKYRAIPFEANFEGVLKVAMSDPLNLSAIDDLRLMTQMKIEPFLAFDDEVEWAINMNYTMTDVAKAAMLEFEEQEEEEETEEEEEELGQAPIIRLVNSIFEQAIRVKASDIHIEPKEKELSIRFRIDGDLKEIMRAPKSAESAVVARIKIMSRLDISEKRIPQDGRIEMSILGRSVDFRVSVLPTVYGEKIVLRVLDRGSVLLTIKELGFTEQNEERFQQLMRIPEGVILVSGPTGSGKTTTLYAALADINQPNLNIITIEDPVEYSLSGINQVQVNNKAGLDFSAGLRSILRQDPDVIMVGEIRDKETAEIAIRSAITGHKVLSTIHTNDAVSSIVRLIDMGIEDFLVASALSGVIAQRLVKRICLSCKETREATDEEKAILKLDLNEPAIIAAGRGCVACGGSGYSGRRAIHEVLVMNEELRSMFLRNALTSEIKKHAIEEGMESLYQSCVRLVLAQDTTIEELFRVAYTVE